MNFECIENLQDFLVKSYPDTNIDSEWNIIPEICPPGMTGDITINCFRLAKIFKKNPEELAKKTLNFLSAHKDVEKAEKIKVFINITLILPALYRDSIEKINKLLNSAVLPKKKQKCILIEYSAPNTNKPQHLGHVRNNTLGMSLSSLLRRIGHELIPVNLINDRGIHICKSMLAYQRFGNNVSPEKSGKKGDHLVGDFYVRFDEELQKQLAALREAKPELTGKNDEELFIQTEIGQAAQKMLRDWESGDEKVRALWKTMNDWVLAGFAETYKRMGVNFEHTYFESETYLWGKEVIAKGIKDGVFVERNGAVTVDLDDYKLGQKALLRSDGTSVYITQDLGTTIKKHEDYHPDMQIWIVGDEQILHFKILFAILRKLGYTWAEHLHHLAYGMVNLPSGKMKSREGTVVDADNLFDEMARLAKNAVMERCGDEIPEDIDLRTEIIGMGALKFMLLKFNPKTTIMFDPQASIKFEGDTGPYVQYACVRINSIRKKGEERGIKLDNSDIVWGMLSSKEEKQLAVLASQYPVILLQAAEKMDCSVLVSYLLDLAKAFSRFYKERPVLNAETPDLRKARLALSCRIGDILTDGLKTLTIDIPEAM